MTVRTRSTGLTAVVDPDGGVVGGVDSAIHTGARHVAAYTPGASEVKQFRGVAITEGGAVTLATPASGKRIRIISFSTIYTAALENYTDFYFGTSPTTTDQIWTAHTEETFRESSMVWPDGGGPLGAVDQVVRCDPSTAIDTGAATFHIVYREE